MIKFEKSIFINRPQQEVFDFLSNFENDTQWQSSLISAVRISDGPTGEGSTWRYTSKYLGREAEADIEMTSYDPPHQISAKTISGPVPVESTNKFEAQDGGTLVTTSIQAEIGGFFKIAEGLAGKQIEKQIEADRAALKKLLESK
jgi:uncharacterized membrane protein